MREGTSQLRRRAARIAAGPVGATVMILTVTLLRLTLGRPFPRIVSFALYFPIILLCGLLGGGRTGAISVFLALFGWTVIIRSERSPPDTASEIANLVVFMLVSAVLAFAGARMKALLERRSYDNLVLAERELRYRTLFEGMSDGFALLQGVWRNNRLIDVILVETNPALLRMFEAEGVVAGRSIAILHLDAVAGYLDAAQRAFNGEKVEFTLQTARSGNWYELRLSTVGVNRVAQIVVDVTARKLAEQRQTELFDELNHRVKNNLALVSAILGMQARLTGSAELQEHLQNAVARIQTIADVHASLYRSGRRDDVDFAVYLQHLTERLSSSVIDPGRLRIALTTDPATVSLDDAVALGLIVNELVTNAAKYAYPEGAGVIEVLLRDTPDGLRLTVRDEGRGLSPQGSGSGLGMRLVRSLVQQCGGVLRVGAGPGASFTVELQPRPEASPVEAAQTRLL